MKLRNKKTGEIVVFGEGIVDLNKIGCKNVVEMIEAGWEDYDDTKDHWCISFYGEAKRIGKYGNREEIDECKTIGNYFKTKEEAERAVEKLKAWKQLKDKGFRFKTWGWEKQSGKEFTIWFTIEDFENSTKDLGLLFGGEDE